MSCATGESIGVVWYEFEAETESVELLTCRSTDGDDSVFALYEGLCGSSDDLTELACSEDQGCGDGTGLGRICYCADTDKPPLTIGQTYYVQFASWDAESRGTYLVDIECSCPDCVRACCLPAGDCAVLSTYECVSQGGTIPPEGTTCQDLECFDTGACCKADGTCEFMIKADCLALEPPPRAFHWLADCTPDPCAGACCSSVPGELSCEDLDALGCQDLSGIFYPGESCEGMLFQCPDATVCQGLSGDEAKCQQISFEHWPADMAGAVSDAGAQFGHGFGISRADDFVAVGDAIDQLCWYGFYYDVNQPVPAPPPAEVADDFTITYYAADPVELCPTSVIASFSQAQGSLAVTRTPTGQRVLPDSVYPQGRQIWLYGGTHALVPVTPGEVYWIEIVNNADSHPDYPTRGWFWSTAPFGQGNGVSLAADGQPASGYGCPSEDSWRGWDHAFCLSADISAPVRCEDVCAGATMQEGEPTCYDGYVDEYNPGCSPLVPSEPPVMTDLEAGDSVCGRTGTFLCETQCLSDQDCPPAETCLTTGYCSGGPYNCRDVDWYRLWVPQTGEVRLSITADFPYYAALFNPLGADVCRRAMGRTAVITGAACASSEADLTLLAGLYYIQMSTNEVFWGVPCDEHSYLLDSEFGLAFCNVESVESCVVHHGGAGRICLDLTGGQVEPRGGVEELEVTYGGASGFYGGVSVDCGWSPWAGQVDISANGPVVTLSFTPPLPTESACEIQLECAERPFCVRSIKGDVDRSGTVTTADLSAVKAVVGSPASESPATAAVDQDLNGIVSTADLSAIKPLFGHSSPSCP